MKVVKLGMELRLFVGGSLASLVLRRKTIARRAQAHERIFRRFYYNMKEDRFAKSNIRKTDVNYLEKKFAAW